MPGFQYKIRCCLEVHTEFFVARTVQSKFKKLLNQKYILAFIQIYVNI